VRVLLRAFDTQFSGKPFFVDLNENMGVQSWLDVLSRVDNVLDFRAYRLLPGHQDVGASQAGFAIANPLLLPWASPSSLHPHNPFLLHIVLRTEEYDEETDWHIIGVLKHDNSDTDASKSDASPTKPRLTPCMVPSGTDITKTKNLWDMELAELVATAPLLGVNDKFGSEVEYMEAMYLAHDHAKSTTCMTIMWQELPGPVFPAQAVRDHLYLRSTSTD